LKKIKEKLREKMMEGKRKDDKLAESEAKAKAAIAASKA